MAQDGQHLQGSVSMIRSTCLVRKVSGLLLDQDLVMCWLLLGSGVSIQI